MLPLCKQRCHACSQLPDKPKLVVWKKAESCEVCEEARSNSLARLAGWWAVKYKLVGIWVP